MKKAKVGYPGGCELGPRPINMHIAALSKLGLCIHDRCGILDCSLRDNFKGTTLNLSIPSVGVTENIMLAACTADGTTKIINAAREPEIGDLADFLNKCGANIRGAGERVIIIDGVSRLAGCRHRIIPDRIEAATFMAAAAVTGGRVRLNRVIPEHVEPVFSAFTEAGCELNVRSESIFLTAPGRLSRIKHIKTQVYPGFPTDAQAPIMAMASVADGTSVFTETIFRDRYKHVNELSRMGAKITVQGSMAVVEGVPELHGARVRAPDLRGGAALLIAALAAKSTGVIDGACHIDRGYERIERSLRMLGADVVRS